MAAGKLKLGLENEKLLSSDESCLLRVSHFEGIFTQRLVTSVLFLLEMNKIADVVQL
jgi:hypothetical protein